MQQQQKNNFDREVNAGDWIEGRLSAILTTSIRLLEFLLRSAWGWAISLLTCKIGRSCYTPTLKQKHMHAHVEDMPNQVSNVTEN